jgi:hypothetical protein
VYLGEWKHNVKSGHGRLTAPGNAFVYNGDFKNDAMQGEGKWENADDGEERRGRGRGEHIFWLVAINLLNLAAMFDRLFLTCPLKCMPCDVYE